VESTLSRLPLLLLLAGCNRLDLTFEAPIEHPQAAFLSAGGTGPDDVWIVGAQADALGPPTLLHRDGSGDWSTLEVPSVLHDIWWVHAFEGGPTFFAGGGATVLRVEGDEVERTPTPVFFGNTIYGMWGPSPDDLWAVGGFAGRDGFIWHYDGTSWTAEDVPLDIPRAANGEVPALFKVWGRSSDDVWVVGGAGTILHNDGSGWKVVDSGTTEQLFTVFGDEDSVYAVGGSTNGVFIEGGTDGFTNATPEGAPLLQGLTVDADGNTYVAGGSGYAAVRADGKSDWEPLALNFDTPPQSVHALWHDGDSLWAVGGQVLSPVLDAGQVATSEAGSATWAPDAIDTTTPATCPDGRVDIHPTGSMARRWTELLLDSIRRDFPHPPVHARNIHHVGVAMYDAWATYQEVADGVVYTDRHTGTDADVDVAISYAAYRMLVQRYSVAIGSEVSLDCYDAFMDTLGLDPTDTHTEGDDPIAVGNRIGQAVIDRFLNDGANETEGYIDTTGWTPDNPVMVVDLPGTNCEDPDIWQQLNLGTAETQNGIVLDDSVQPYIGPQWRNVEPYGMTRNASTGLYSDPGDGYPSVNDPEMADWVLQVIEKTAELDIDDGAEIDIGPASRGNNTLGLDDGTGYEINPVTGQPYAPNVTLRGDFARVVAETWADGPTSETPPGHWIKLGNEVSDRLTADELVPWGEGDAVDRLAWDVGLYLGIGGAVHDAAIAAWELKRDSLGPRPITLIRWMADLGQRTDPSLPSYHEDGLPLVPDLVELITEESAAPGERHHHLRFHIGEIAVWSWPGEPGDRKADHTPLQWMRAKDWIPYQRRTFVTPAFPGFVSGHSTFSRAAAEMLTQWTGSEYFPGGLHEFVGDAGAVLKFEYGPERPIRLQWARYYDAADEAGQSRLWGGIHIFPDDGDGRIAGDIAGRAAAERTRALWTGSER
jgi:hypothetical protein